ncbi:MAG: PLP-dependent aminotransferase family protein [Thiobacillaceae bacterium]
MTKKRISDDIPSLGVIDRAAGQVGRQLACRLREIIIKGELKPCDRLPSTRALASSLGLARGTVVEVYDQLAAEGYLDARIGAGTSIAQALEGCSPLPRPDSMAESKSVRLKLPPNAKRYAAIARFLAPLPAVPFSIAVATGAVAPDDNWRRLSNRIQATRAAVPPSYEDPRGLIELRVAIADYVRKARAVTCEPRQVIITGGTQQGLYLAGRVLLVPGDAVWTENPAYPGLTAVLGDCDIRTHRLPVDQQGIDVAQGIADSPSARAAFVTPSHQYPLGMPLSMSRRTALLAWARENGSWLVEDDYDSELRYAGHPFPSLQGMDPTRVVYLGTFSKVLFPALRLGYAIVPEPLVEAFAGARALMDRHSPTVDQHVLAAFMREGYFGTHIRRIRSVYAERRTALIAAIGKELSPWVSLQPSDQGMHLVIWLRARIDDIQVAALAEAAGVVVRAVSPMYGEKSRRSGLMLGFGGFPADQLEMAVGRLRAVLETLQKL